MATQACDFKTNCGYSSYPVSSYTTEKASVSEWLVEEVATRFFNQVVVPHAPEFGAFVGGLFCAQTLNSLAKPGSNGAIMLISAVASFSLATYAYNQRPENLALHSGLFLGSALLMAFKRIKSLENQLATKLSEQVSTI